MFSFSARAYATLIFSLFAIAFVFIVTPLRFRFFAMLFLQFERILLHATDALFIDTPCQLLLLLLRLLMLRYY